MLTFQAMREKTAYMMEEMRRSAVDVTVKQFKAAARRYYERGYDEGQTVRLIHELEELGVDPDVIFDMDWEIRSAVEEVKHGI